MIPWLIAYYDERYVTGRFGDPRPGRTHQGADFSHSRTPGLAPVPALLDGTVVKVWKNDSTHGYGNRVDVATVRGEVSYAHLHAPSPFRKGDRVVQGDVVGHEGITGFVAGSCCHVEHAVNGVKRDPLPLIRDVLAGPSGGEVTPTPTTRKKKPVTLYRKNNTKPDLYALAGESPGTDANWIETADPELARAFAAVHGSAVTLSPATFDSFSARYRQPVRVRS